MNSLDIFSVRALMRALEQIHSTMDLEVTLFLQLSKMGSVQSQHFEEAGRLGLAVSEPLSRLTPADFRFDPKVQRHRQAALAANSRNGAGEAGFFFQAPESSDTLHCARVHK